MENKDLLKYAWEAMEGAYAPYSDFKVGAAIVAKKADNTEIFTGCNIENSSYGATICAERTAAVKAVSSGYTRFEKIAIVSSSGEFTYPCGICRQFLGEFADENMIFVFEDRHLGIKEVSIRDLLPYSFKLNK